MAVTPRPSKKFFNRLESRFEAALWKLRLVAILPVVMTAISSLATFILGTKETWHSLKLMMQGGGSDKGSIAEVLGGFVGGVDLYLVGIALLIFSYGTYELLISAIDPARDGAIVRFRKGVEVSPPGFIGRLLTIALLQLPHRLGQEGQVGMDPLLVRILD